MNPIQKVYRKEIREMLRDRRVRVSAFLLPAVVIYMIFNLFGFIGDVVGKKGNQKVHVVGTLDPTLAAVTKGLLVVQVPTLDEGKRLIKQSKADLVLDPGQPTAEGHRRIQAYFDPKQERAQVVLRSVQKMVSEEDAKSAQAYLLAHKISPAALAPLSLEEKPLKIGEEGTGSQLLVQILPYLLIMFAFSGGMSVATELVAGEKDKNTLETLLITPVRRTQIVLGKFMSLMAVCLLSMTSSLAGLFLFAMTKASSSSIFQGGLGVTPKAMGTVFIVLVPMVAFFAGLLIAVSSYAKNVREAQTHLALMNIVIIMPAVFSQFIGYTEFGNSFAINFVPILNTANSIRTALLGKADPMGIAVTVAISLVLAAIGVRVAVWLFNREQVLTRV